MQEIKANIKYLFMILFCSVILIVEFIICLIIFSTPTNVVNACDEGTFYLPIENNETFCGEDSYRDEVYFINYALETGKTYYIDGTLYLVDYEIVENPNGFKTTIIHSKTPIVEKRFSFVPNHYDDSVEVHWYIDKDLLKDNQRLEATYKAAAM